MLIMVLWKILEEKCNINRGNQNMNIFKNFKIFCKNIWLM